MTSRGRQYPDGPLEAPPGSIWEQLTVPVESFLAVYDSGCYWPIEDAGEAPGSSPATS